MQEILSQAEIDSLLAALFSGKVRPEELKETEKQVGYRPYDFRRPNKFTKDHLNTLRMLHDNYARLLSSFLSGYLRANIVVRVASVDQFTFDDFLRSVPTPTLMTVFSLEPLKGLAVMETNPQFLFPVIDLLFGGPGDIPKKVREFTDIELSVARKVCVKLLENLEVVWADVYPVKPQVETVEANPRLHQIISPSEVVAVVTLTTVVGGTSRGLINLCLPFLLLEPVLAELSAHYRLVGRGAHQEETELKHLKYWLGRSTLDLVVVAGETQITVGELLRLQVGDVLPLQKKKDQDIDLYVANRLKFKVQPGTLGRRLAVQVTSLAEGGGAFV
jgi:flagellar motor switch protein FliM